MDRMRKLSLGVPPFAKSAINTAPSISQGNHSPLFPALSSALDLIPRISIPPALSKPSVSPILNLNASPVSDIISICLLSFTIDTYDTASPSEPTPQDTSCPPSTAVPPTASFSTTTSNPNSPLVCIGGHLSLPTSQSINHLRN